MADLNELPRPEGAHRARKRIGRGVGSGLGKTSGFGHKGSKARTGHHGPGGGKQAFEGGQMPIQRRLPKRGFTSPNRVEYQVVNVGQLAKLGDAEFSAASLRERGLIGNAHRPLKVLGNGELDRAITVRADAFSASAREKIEKAGGRAEAVGGA